MGVSGRVDVWGRDRADALTALVEAALPGEGLTADELLACCFDDPGVVLGLPDGEGAVAAVTRPWGEPPAGIVKLLVVDPAAQGEGRGRALLEAAQAWAFDQAGAGEMHLGKSAPFYLWPGVDVRFTPMLALAETAGYGPDGAALNMAYPTSFRAEAPAGVGVRRVLDDADAAAVLELAQRWPGWVPEVQRGIECGAVHSAFDAETGSVLAFVCHSVNRAGWLGPMATHPDARRRGTGRALLAAVAADLRPAGFADVEVAWVGPVGFYARAAGAVVSRVFRTAHLPKP